jgi:hypothetical protein
MKHCGRCREVKSFDEFYCSSKSKDGRQGYCKACVRDDMRERAARRPRKNRVRGKAPIGFKHCMDCDQIKPLEDFCNNKRSSDGKAAYCKDCHNGRGIESKQRLYGGTRHYHLMRRYSIGVADVDAMIEAQGGLCAICREREPEHVDHDHKTGKNRGITCSCCNQGLGNFRDRADLLELAVEYLLEHNLELDDLRDKTRARLEDLNLARIVEAAQIERLRRRSQRVSEQAS